MPRYDYKCIVCGKEFEVTQSFSDPSVEYCVDCGGGIKKLYSSPALVFKGSGWHSKDYGKK